jgi:hypothetical protein
MCPRKNKQRNKAPCPGGTAGQLDTETDFSQPPPHLNPNSVSTRLLWATKVFRDNPFVLTEGAPLFVLFVSGTNSRGPKDM